MPFTATDVYGRQLRDVSGRGVGQVTGFYRYPADLDAPWGVAVVTRGSVFRSTHLVDLYGASIEQDTVVVSYPLEQIKKAPHDQAAVGDILGDEHATRVLTHYRGTPQLVA